MRILYYCPEYYYRHGGRSHARGFFSALGKLPSVSACFLYPGSKPQEDSGDTPGNKSSREKLRFLPQMARQIVRFFLPRRRLTRDVIQELINNRCDAVVIRTGTRQPSIRAIKKACPDISVCLEINSAYFDESFPRLPLRSLFQRWEVRRFSQADAIVVVSSYLKTYLEKRGLPPEKILVNQNGVDVEAVDHTGSNSVRETYGIPEDAFVIGYIGGMESFRRLPEVVSRIAALRRAGHRDVYLLMVGDGGDMPLVKEAVDREALENAVILTGWVPHTEVAGYLASFDIAIFPFTNDYCSPLKLFEYLAAGLATLGPDTPAVREVFQDDVHLKLVKQNGADFIEKILQIKNDPEHGSGLARAGQKLVLEKYTWEKNAQRVVAHILRLTGVASAATP